MDRAERQTFKKEERLCKTKLIGEIFENGNVFYTSLFRVIWIAGMLDMPFQAQIAISVPKKSFRLAVKRNLIKRRTREAYRKLKPKLYNCLAQDNIKVAFVLVYRDTNIKDYLNIEKSVEEVIERLCNYARKGI